MSATGARWRNWGRTVSVVPRRVERPADTGAVQRAVAAASRQHLTVKPVGAGHSFTPIAEARDVQLDIDALTGVLAADPAARRLTLGAGTRLRHLPVLLAPYGLAMENLGDIDAQTLAGATSTGTHGTGGSFRGLAAQIVGLELVTGTGELLSVDENHNADLLPAARLGLGALGVVTAITLQLVPAFVLHAVERPEPFEETLESYLQRCASEDHFEFYWFPHTETALTKTNTRLPADAPRHPLPRAGRWVSDELLANGVYRMACAAGVVAPGIIPPFNRLAQRLTGNREFTDVSTAVFTTNRSVRFREMEYALPRSAVPAALREVKGLIARKGWRISFPVEVRAAAADDIWLSTGYGRDSGYIAVHRYYREGPKEYFREIEAIMRAHDGRPHWGKMHTRTADDLRAAYPRFDDFLAARDRLDPERVFANRYLDTVLGR